MTFLFHYSAITFLNCRDHTLFPPCVFWLLHISTQRQFITIWRVVFNTGSICENLLQNGMTQKHNATLEYNTEDSLSKWSWEAFPFWPIYCDGEYKIVHTSNVLLNLCSWYPILIFKAQALPVPSIGWSFFLCIFLSFFLSQTFQIWI